MFQANMPQTFWREAILMATSIINVVPSKIMKWKTPHDILYGKRPNYNLFKVFGVNAILQMSIHIRENLFLGPMKQSSWYFI